MDQQLQQKKTLGNKIQKMQTSIAASGSESSGVAKLHSILEEKH